MTLFLSNFLRRAGDFVRQNRARLIRWALILAACLIGAALIYYGVERLHKWRYEKAVQALEKQYQEADARAKQAERQAELLKNAIETKYGELRVLQERAAAAEKRVGETRVVYRTLKETYETVRNAPDIPACVSYADACRELAGTGYPCK